MERLTSVMKSAVSYSRLRSLWTLQKSSRGITTYKWEPDLNLEPEIPEYETLDIKVQGYDYPVLESFSKYIHRVAVNFDIDCVRFPVPAKKYDVNRLEFGKKNITDTFNLQYYERVVQLQKPQSIQVSLLLDAILGSTPEGVNITLRQNTEEDQEYLYVPDHLKLRLEAMIGLVEARKKMH